MHSEYPRWSQELLPGQGGTLRLTLDPGIHDHGREQPVVQGAFIYSDDVRAPRALVKVIARIEG
ncbi:MAG: hypothetical protein HYT85_03190 [candidate division NC10 bacterium]|nr:hypothetical protein [candidate division NC10 bacterium]MBI2114081.1 hypothetical protein [candidate division NC10 bacterium]MBI2457470.1 hypothetical protein [candidate division NC10 bacterium]